MYDYALGKNDWLAHDLPYEGEAQLVGASLVRDLPTCAEDDPVSEVVDRMASSPLPGLVVVNELDVVMGILPADAPATGADARVGDLMVEGPTTVRPSEDPEMLAHRMDHADVAAIPVTRPDGVLLGVFVRGRERSPG